jgi:hypothetical protein
MLDGIPGTVVLKPITKEKYSKKNGGKELGKEEIKISPSPLNCASMSLSMFFFFFNEIGSSEFKK